VGHPLVEADQDLARASSATTAAPWSAPAKLQMASRSSKIQVQTEEMAALSVGEPEFFDLEQPWLHSPR
jgi:hypothetical protein